MGRMCYVLCIMLSFPLGWGIALVDGGRRGFRRELERSVGELAGANVVIVVLVAFISAVIYAAATGQLK